MQYVLDFTSEITICGNLTLSIGDYINWSVQKCSELLEKAVKSQNIKLDGMTEKIAY